MPMIKLDLKTLLIVDIEATCFDPKPNTWGVSSQDVDTWEYQSEIIEVGVCELDLDKGILSKESIIVRPTYSKVSDFCTKLTTLTQKDVDAGIRLVEACGILQKKFNSPNRVWVSYGDYDRKQFEKECKSKAVGYPFGPRHLNIKNIFALMYRLEEEVSMPEALKVLRLELEGTLHRGIYDAYNIAKITQRLFER